MADQNNTNGTEGYEMKMPETDVVNPNSTPAPAATTTTIPPAEKHSYLAPIIGVIIVLVVLALAALYLWGAQLMNMNDDAMTEEMTTATTTEETMVEEQPPEESFTEIDSEIDAELQAFDAELDQMETEIDGSTTIQ